MKSYFSVLCTIEQNKKHKKLPLVFIYILLISKNIEHSYLDSNNNIYIFFQDNPRTLILCYHFRPFFGTLEENAKHDKVAPGVNLYFTVKIQIYICGFQKQILPKN